MRSEIRTLWFCKFRKLKNQLLKSEHNMQLFLMEVGIN